MKKLFLTVALAAAILTGCEEDTTRNDITETIWVWINPVNMNDMITLNFYTNNDVRLIDEAPGEETIVRDLSYTYYHGDVIASDFGEDVFEAVVRDRAMLLTFIGGDTFTFKKLQL